jgi:hypothetical protein
MCGRFLPIAELMSVPRLRATLAAFKRLGFRRSEDVKAYGVRFMRFV